MKKILKSLVMVALVVVVMTAFTGCDLEATIMGWLNPQPVEPQPDCVHEVVTDEAVEPSCTEKGLTEGYHCALCDLVILPQYDVKALGHKVGENGKAATCTEAAVCGTCEQSFGEALGHNFADATCVAPKTCKVEGCGATDGEPDPENHTYADATCVAPATCKDCGATDGEPNPENHSFDANDVCEHCHVVLVTVYFYNADAWEAVHLYSWINGANGVDKYTGDWPGAAMQQLNATWYGVQFLVPSTEGLMIIFNNGAGAQTDDLAYDHANIFWVNGQAYASQADAEAAVSGAGSEATE